MSTKTPSEAPTPSPSIFNWTLGFLLVGLAWGLTTPFIRRAAVNFHPPPHNSLSRIDTSTKTGWVKFKIVKGFFTVVDLLRSPSYAVPLVINLTGSVWFFLLIGKAGELDCFFGRRGVVGVDVGRGVGKGRIWEGKGRDRTKAMETRVVLRALEMQLLIRAVCRIESYGADHEFVGIPVHGAGGVVGGREGDIKRQVVSSSVHLPNRMHTNYGIQIPGLAWRLY